MRGDLVEKAAADVCRELAAQGASGVLAIDGPGGPGRVVFADGRIIAAVSPTPRARLGDRLVGAGELDPDDLANALDAQQEEGESLPLGSLLVERGLVRRDAVRVFVQEQVLDALFEIIRWRYGAFTFAHDEAGVHGVPLSLSVDDALVEVARRRHEWDELSQVIPDLDSVPSFRSGATTADAALEPDEFAVLTGVDGVRSVRALAADLGYGEFEVARILYGLSQLGIVDVRPPQDEIGAALEDALGLGDFEPPSTAGPVMGPVEAETQDEPTLDAPAPPPSHLHVVAEPPEPPADEPDQPAAATGATSDDRHPDTDGGAGPASPSGTPIDAEVDLPADAVAYPGATDPAVAEQVGEPAADEDPGQTGRAGAVDEETIGRWDELFSAAERAATDPSEGIEDRATTAAARSDEGSPTDPTTGPEPWTSSASDPAEPAEPAEQPTPRTPPSSSPPPTQPPPTQPPPSRSEPDEPEQPAASAQDEPSTPGASPGQRGDDNDVSEFLRELSRLSVDGPSDATAPKPPVRPSSSSSSSSSSDDGKKKRRGLFGRG